MRDDMDPAHRDQFGTVWNGACCTIGLLYTAVGMLGLATYGRGTNVLITDNMDSSVAAGLVAVNCATTVAPLVLVSSELPAAALGVAAHRQARVRAAVFAAAVCVAYLCADRLLVLETIAGMLLGLTSLVGPVALWACVAWPSGSGIWRAGMSTLLSAIMAGYAWSLSGMDLSAADGLAAGSTS